MIRLFSLASILVFLLGSLPAFAAQPATELVIAYQPFASPSGTIFEVVKRDRALKRSLAQQGLSLRMMPVSHGSEAIKLFKQGQIAMTTLGDMPTIELAAAVPVTIAAQLKQNYAMVVGEKGTVAKNLKGKRIANVFASSGHFALLKVLSSGGLSEKEVTLVTMPVNQMADALSKGIVDAVAAWEPTPSLIVADAPDRFAVIGRQSTSSYLVVQRSMATQHPEALRQVTAAVARAMFWLKQDQQLRRAVDWNLATIASLGTSSPGNHPDELVRVTARDLAAIRYSPRLTQPARAATTPALAEELEFLKRVGKIAPEVRWETIQQSFQPELVEQVTRNPQTYALKRYEYE